MGPELGRFPIGSISLGITNASSIDAKVSITRNEANILDQQYGLLKNDKIFLILIAKINAIADLSLDNMDSVICGHVNDTTVEPHSR